MWFNSWEFALFLPVVLLVYYTLRLRAQNVWLLCASYLFYGWWDWRFLSLIALSTLTDYIIGRTLGSDQTTLPRKGLLGISILVNLGILGVFKYFNFFVDSFIALGATVGLNFDTPVMRLLPPVGISFYTFQTLSYSIDIYRRKLEPVKDLGAFALYVCYFPQLVAGPIERAHRLLPQILCKREVTLELIRTGLVLILIGLFKKIAIADTAGARVEDIFADPNAQSSLMLWKGMMLFSIQIYGDFSGYSNIARGVSRLFGIELIENFRTPYLAANITDFWRRWHVSLSAWLKDYLYIPLGGNRSGKANTYRNLMLTMLIGGLWHGAAWTFVVWGALHGLYLCVHRVWVRWKPAIDDSGTIMRGLAWCASVVLTFHLVAVAWVFFRAESFTHAFDYLQGLLAFRGGIAISDVALPGLLVLCLAPLELVQYKRGEVFAILEWPVVARALVYLAMLLALVFMSGHEVPFIYFQF